jgi:restriction system protein
LLIDYALPKIEAIPTLKAVRYAPRRKTFEHLSLGDDEVRAVYEDTIFQICLRTVYQVFAADTAFAVQSIIFNGWLDFDHVGQAGCILALDVTREALMATNLRGDSARTCFLLLNGKTGTPLGGAIVPIDRPEEMRFAV